MIFSNILHYDILWLLFLISGVLTLFFAAKTVRYFTLFNMRTKMSSSALGGILLALITSLPELINGIVSGISGDSALVYSNVIGANTILLVFYAIFAIFFITKTMKHVSSKSLNALVLSVIMSIILFIVLFFLKESLTLKINNHKISIAVIFQLMMYIGFIIYLSQSKADLEEPSIIIQTKLKSKTQIFLVFIFFSALLITSAILLNNVVSKMGQNVSSGGYGLGSTLTGALFLSVITTLPEITSMYKLMKMGFFNIAAAAGIGSHMFNFTILFVSDMITSGSFLEKVYLSNYIQQKYIWIIYLFTYILFINGIYNPLLKKRKELMNFNYINILIVFIGGWLAFGIIE